MSRLTEIAAALLLSYAVLIAVAWVPPPSNRGLGVSVLLIYVAILVRGANRD